MLVTKRSEFGELGLEDRFHEAIEVFGYLVVDIEARLLSILKLHFVDIAILVADSRRHKVVWQIRRLRKRNELRTQLSDSLFHGALHCAVSARGKETRVIDCSAVFKQLLEGVDLGHELHELGDAWVSEVSLLDRGAEDVEGEVAQMGNSHGKLWLLELVIVLVDG